MTEPVHTRWAEISWLSPNEIEIRFTSGILLDRAAIAEVIAARKHMQGEKPVGLLLIVPNDTELDMSVIGMDHLKVHQATDHVVGFAVVANSGISEVLLRLYKAYYPTVFEAEVFTQETEARTWLSKQVARALEPQG
ncbi:MAG TPA: STAS/SEC14 domain-containing protein [Flavobacteriales bacterium]|nr:STAS/SEC14 domain-containing protein [Flavobacteriales bacterium]